jgi:hypothetical protein
MAFVDLQQVLQYPEGHQFVRLGLMLKQNVDRQHPFSPATGGASRLQHQVGRQVPVVRLHELRRVHAHLLEDDPSDARRRISRVSRTLAGCSSGTFRPFSWKLRTSRSIRARSMIGDS